MKGMEEMGDLERMKMGDPRKENLRDVNLFGGTIRLEYEEILKKYPLGPEAIKDLRFDAEKGWMVKNETIDEWDERFKSLGEGSDNSNMYK